MDDIRRLSAVAEMICDHVSLDGPDEIDRFMQATELREGDFVALQPQEFGGEIFAVDGSNAPICSWSTASVNLIRAGYAVYRGREWQRTVITFDDLFMADEKLIPDTFDPYLEEFFGLSGAAFSEPDLERLSSYYREMQEYIAIDDALRHARAGDLILYDGSFDVFEPLRGAVASLFSKARENEVALLAVAKASALTWGEEISLPFVPHAALAGSLLLPDSAWYLRLKDKKVDAGQGRWNGEPFVVRFCGQSHHAFRVDSPAYLVAQIGSILAKAAAYSCSAECLGYPHALFRAHRDIRIAEPERQAVRRRLISRLADMGMSRFQLNLLMEDIHDILEMRPSF
ncbi:MAG TPA: DNA double-strand break repair nuclease NurA [Methanothrix sp.]|jgi:hypothetical protein|nr:DNA double-strand break repair nuclease NurA [Methanothrix sp.]HOV81353.1 DNA double-strand break repair nuclease NurA [Methanothrix sp.]HPC89939.1 DNA double-strand break repair nuclease NurA [Methanothrix sp.]HQE87016.1 DNA double-strand break repair nuclease NurA [Methanothrix sp.]HQI67345.1 DNA double-strand break repair nuclease NurA [Methanothrix sp.]